VFLSRALSLDLPAVVGKSTVQMLSWGTIIDK
jgi:hypothetical protein